MYQYDLAVVIPTFNEVKNIQNVINDWKDILEKNKIHYQIIIINDGSRDGSAELLGQLSKEDDHLTVIHQLNIGHGPTLLKGYQHALHLKAQWVFQVDSDDEIKAKEFPRLWLARESADFILGERQGKRIFLRKWISLLSQRWGAFLFQEKRIKDPNSPFRLFRGSSLAKVIRLIPLNSFAPNIMLTYLFCFFGARVKRFEVSYDQRHHSEFKLKNLKIFKAAILSFWQLLSLRLSLFRLPITPKANDNLNHENRENENGPPLTKTIGM